MTTAATPTSGSDDVDVVWALTDDPEEERPMWPDDPGAEQTPQT